MNFFDLAIEIRLKIYSELLVLPDPIFFDLECSPSSLCLVRRKREGLCLYPALLRINKKTHREASPLLYSNNRFRFPDIFFLGSSSNIGIFLCQIGSQASLIRHIYNDFPRLDDYKYDGDYMYGYGGWYNEDARDVDRLYIQTLELIQNTCTSITTLELYLPLKLTYTLRGVQVPIPAQSLDLLNERLKIISSLKRNIVKIRPYRDEDISDLTKKMRDYGWTVKIDDEEACDAFSHEQILFRQR